MISIGKAMDFIKNQRNQLKINGFVEFGTKFLKVNSPKSLYLRSQCTKFKKCGTVVKGYITALFWYQDY